MKLLITGATGVAGLNIYRAALQDATITSITLLMRREIPSWAELPSNASQKTDTIIHQDFLNYSPDVASSLAQHDACIWALGKSARGMSEADYTVLTYDYPMALLRAIEEAGAGKNRPVDKPFRFLYFSGELADPTGKSGQMWARVKGRTETDVIKFCADAPGLQGHIIRPAYFRPPRKYPGDWANQRTTAESVIDRVLGPTLSTFLPVYVSPIDSMTKVVLEIAKGRWPDVELFRNKQILELAKTL